MPDNLKRPGRLRMTDFRQNQRLAQPRQPRSDEAAASVVTKATERLRANGHLYFELQLTESARIEATVRHYRREDAALAEYGERYYAEDPLTADFRDRLRGGEAIAHGPAIVALGELPQKLRMSYENRFLHRAGIADVLGLGVPVYIDRSPRMLCFGFHRGSADPSFTRADRDALAKVVEDLRLRAENLAMREELARHSFFKLLTPLPLDVAEAAGLTKRERETADLMMAGCSNRQLASELGLTINTVENHLRSIYGKLGVRSRAQATARLIGLAH